MIEALPDRPLLVFDAQCAFCGVWVEYWKQLTGDRALYVPYQELGDRLPMLGRQDFAAAVQLLLPSGDVFRGAYAIVRLLALPPGRHFSLWLYEQVPGLAALAERAYRVIARHRSLAYQVTKLLWGIPLERETFAYASGLFLRLLGLIYLLAFVSFGVQAQGLIGSHGILPAAEFLQAAKDYFAASRFSSVPTLLWVSSSDVMLRAVWLGGVILSGLQFAGANSRLIRIALYILYLSLVSAGQQFMSYQWDALLLEAGFLVVFLAWSPRMVQLFRWLLFRLMFLSGAVKLLSHDRAWHNFSALPVHYQTQPLPTPLAWYFYRFPGWFQQTSVGFVFFIELLVPFLILAPRRLRIAAAPAITSLQLLIALTGNYAFFNLLTVSLCLFLFDDSFFRRHLPICRWRRWQPKEKYRSSGWTDRLCAAIYVLVLFLSGFEMAGMFSGVHWRPADKVISLVAPFEIVNTYGLFAVMTTIRPEIIVEGSNDGINWLPYEFKYKPGPLARRPPWIAPHQPRLDWQMWFAALGDQRPDSWVLQFMARLLEGSPDVLRLLRNDPFPRAPPHYLRAQVYEYRFTTPEERRRTGDWWRREWKGEYIPPISLRPLSQRRHPRVSVFWLSVRANPRPSGRARATPAY